MDGTLSIIWEEFVRLLAAVKRSPNTLAAAVRRSCEGMGDRAAEAATGTPGVVALLGLVVVMGALLYGITVQHIFDRAATPDGPAVVAPVSSNASEQTTAVVPQQSGEQATDALYESAVRGFERAFGQVGMGAAPPNAETLAVATDWYGRSSRRSPVPRSYDYGTVFDWVDFRMTPKAGSAQVQGRDLTTLRTASADGRGANSFALQRSSLQDSKGAPRVSAFSSGQRAPSQELQPVQRVNRPVAIPLDSTLPALERAQRIAASGGEGDVEVTALEAIAHGGEAVFDVQHLDETTGVWHPAQVVVTAEALGFLPEGSCEAGAFTVPLELVSSAQAGQSDAERFDANLLNIELSDRGQHGRSMTGRLTLREPLSNGVEPAGVPESEMLTHIRNVIAAAQRRS